MKKLLELTLTCILVLSFAVSANAATAYVDILRCESMEWKDDTGSIEGDLSGIVFGFNNYTEKGKFAVEYLSGTWDNDYFESDITSLDLKGGFQLFDDGYLTIGIISDDIDDYSNLGVLVGLDASFNLTDNLVLEGSAAFSISSEFEWANGTTQDSNLTSLKARLIYIIGDNLAASLGYRNYLIALDNSIDTEFSYSSLTLGLSFRY